MMMMSEQKFIKLILFVLFFYLVTKKADIPIIILIIFIITFYVMFLIYFNFVLFYLSIGKLPTGDVILFYFVCYIIIFYSKN